MSKSREHLNPQSFDNETFSIALVGSPNCGKTTLYNWLTASNYRTVNYPGATVDYSVGNLAQHLKKKFASEDKDIVIYDTPGTYSLYPKSEDEKVTYNCLFNSEIKSQKALKIDVVVVVVDGTQLSRHLLMVEQIKESGYPFIIAITMKDLLEKNKIELDLATLKNFYNVDVVLFNGQLGDGLFSVVESALKLPPSTQEKSYKLSKSHLNFQMDKVQKIAKKIYQNREPVLSDLTMKLDRVALHSVFGPILFLVVMFLIFSSVFWLAAPLMDFVDSLFSFTANVLKNSLPVGLLNDFLTDGVITSMASFIIFTPQIFILFIMISILEDSGYLARAATLIDKPFSKLGLSGRSFIPLLSGYACAIPAIMAARNLSSDRDRKITQFIIPLMSCSARLPVYGLLLGFLFVGQAAWVPGLAMTGIYLFSIFIGGLVAKLLDYLLQKQGHSFLMMELPIYRRPKVRMLLRSSFKRTISFVTKAGPTIFVLSIIMWVLSVFPNYQETDSVLRTQSSYAAQAGKFIEPIVEPMGGDWRVGFALLTAFAAREVFVPSMAVMFNVVDEDESKQITSLIHAIETATNSHGEKIFTIGTVVGLIVFFVVAMQCMSTFAVYKKESGSLSLALLQLFSFNLLAYILAVLTSKGIDFFYY